MCVCVYGVCGKVCGIVCLSVCVHSAFVCGVNVCVVHVCVWRMIVHMYIVGMGCACRSLVWLLNERYCELGCLYAAVCG